MYELTIKSISEGNKSTWIQVDEIDEYVYAKLCLFSSKRNQV